MKKLYEMQTVGGGGGGPFKPFEVSSVVHPEKFMNEYVKRQTKLLLSGGIAASITSSMYNSLDCLRVRWQTLPQIAKADRFASKGIVYFTRYIIRTEGFINGLCLPGVSPALIASGTSAALRFGTYEHIRNALMSSSNGEKNALHMFVAGFTCGSLGFFVTSPLQIIKTKVQASQNHALLNYSGRNVLESKQPHTTRTKIKSVLRKEGFSGFWNGSSTVAARGALFSAGQMLGYDGFKTFCKSNELMEDGVRLHIASSIVAAFMSTALSTPVDFVFARYVSSSSHSSIVGCVRVIYHENGILGFWRGFGLAFCRLCPVMLSYSMLYEQLRKQFGLGYLT